MLRSTSAPIIRGVGARGLGQALREAMSLWENTDPPALFIILRVTVAAVNGGSEKLRTRS